MNKYGVPSNIKVNGVWRPNPEYMRLYRRDWDETHKEQRNEYTRRYRERHRDNVKVGNKRVIKAVKQNFSASPEILELLESFRCMMNDCIRIGLENKITSRESLSYKAYHELSKYKGIPSNRLTAISKAAGLLKNYRKTLKKKSNAKPPYVKNAFVVTHYGIEIENGVLKLPFQTRGQAHLPTYVLIPLTKHTLTVLGGFKVRSITLTKQNLSITYSKDVAEIKPVGFVGVDRNLNNITTADSNGHIERLNLSKVTEIKSKYREVKRHFKRNDVRISKHINGKYGRIQRDKVQQILHRASKLIVQQAKLNKHCIVMEDLKGIDNLYHKGNGQSRNYRAKLSGWGYGELQRQIQYKAEWEGIPVIYVNPWGTSSRCAKCGSRMVSARKPEERRVLECSKCGFTVDRDVNAAMNLAARGLRFKPVASASEAMVSVFNPSVDADELTKLVPHEPTS